MPFNLGMTELLVILMVLLLVFGAKRLPEIGSSMGKGIREFKKSISDMKNTIEEDEDRTPPRRVDAPESGSEREGEPKKLSE
ncbi:MAG: twin-arginine translocase TatA/TatE family subunit [Gemmatimonadales bacterium]|jgi:sec-independent protein translocase protein TatA